MTFTPKSWGDFLSGGTPLTAAALVDLETRLAAYSDLLTPVQMYSGSGAPALAAPLGTLYLRTDSAANQLYIKESGGATSSGWLPVATSSGIFNVKDYGATGDGVTADYATVASAIAAASAAGGGTVYFPPGTYMIATSLAIPSNVRLVGVDKNASVIKKSASITLLDYSGSSNSVRCQRGGAMDLRLDGNGFSGRLINCKWADHLNFDRIWCFNNNDTAFESENLWDTYLNNVEFDTCSGSNGLGPAVQLCSNSDDSTNIIVFNGCRWENFIDGAVTISSRKMVTSYTPQVGSNPPYGIYFTNCKMETPQLRGLVFDMSADISDVHVDGLYVAARGLFAGSVVGRKLFNVIGAYDLTFQTIKILINGVTNPTASEGFRVFTSGANIVIRDIQFDCQQNPSTSLINIAGGVPDVLLENISQRAGQTATMMAGSWPPTRASAATVTLLRLPAVQTISGVTTITSITADLPGRVVTLSFSGILTLTDGGNLKLAGDLVTAADTTITLVCDGTNWIEISRSVN